jgi:hypothetical protein
MNEIVRNKAFKVLMDIFTDNHEINKKLIFEFIKRETEFEDEYNFIRWLKQRDSNEISDVRLEIEQIEINASITPNFLKTFVSEIIDTQDNEDLRIEIFWKSRSYATSISLLDYAVLISEFTVEEINELIKLDENEKNRDDYSILPYKQILLLNENLSKDAKVFLQLH